MDAGEYNTHASVFMGANIEEGLYAISGNRFTIIWYRGDFKMTFRFAEFYKKYVRPHDYEFDEEFMKYGIVPAIFGAFGGLKNVTIHLKNFQINILCWTGVRDDTGALADVIIDKYLAGFQMGNFSDMIPGLIDVNLHSLAAFWKLQLIQRLHLDWRSLLLESWGLANSCRPFETQSTRVLVLVWIPQCSRVLSPRFRASHPSW